MSMIVAMKSEALPASSFRAHENGRLEVHNAHHLQKSRTGGSTLVEQIDLTTGAVLRTFRSQSEAALAIKGSQQLISNVCRGRSLEAYGFCWRFARAQKHTLS